MAGGVAPRGVTVFAPRLLLEVFQVYGEGGSEDQEAEGLAAFRVGELDAERVGVGEYLPSHTAPLLRDAAYLFPAAVLNDEGMWPEDTTLDLRDLATRLRPSARTCGL